MNLLMIAYYFPPDGSSGSFRPMYFAKHFHQKGDQVYVLTARETDFLPDQPKDRNLLSEIFGLQIFRTRVFRPREAVIKLKNSLTHTSEHDHQIITEHTTLKNNNHQGVLQTVKDFITFALSSPDPHIGWLPSALSKGMKIVNQKKIDIIYTTGSPWTCLLAGTGLKLLTGKPVVLDFRDPWVANPGFQVRNKVFRSLESFMERFVVKHADLIVANTSELKKDFIKRYKLPPHRVCTVTNGFEEYVEPRPSMDGKFTLTHAGSLYFSRNPKKLLQAILLLMNEGLLTKNNFIIQFIGGINIDDPELTTLLYNSTIQVVARIIPRIPFHEVCEYQRLSDVLFLIQPDFPLQVPRKLYENMAFKKPVLAITNQNGATAALVKQQGMGIVVENRIDDIADALRQMFLSWEKGKMVKKYNQNHDGYSNTVLSEKMRHQLIRATFKKHYSGKIL